MQKLFIIITITASIIIGCSPKSPVAENSVPPLLLHKSFSFTSEDLPSLTEGLPESIADRIQSKPEEFLDLILSLRSTDSTLVRLVNKEIPLDKDYIPEDLVDLDEYESILSLSRTGHRLRSIVLPSLLDMTKSAEIQGIVLMISSSYRSFDYQEGLYNRYVKRDGQEAADRYSARPGRSQHQLGTAIDFGSIDDSFAETAAGKWLSENAWRYGFSLSYPKNMEFYTGYIWESWHYRYIGKNAAALERVFFEGVQERMLRYLTDKNSMIEAALILK